MGNRFIARHLKLANDSFGRVNDHEGILARSIATPKYALRHPWVTLTRAQPACYTSVFRLLLNRQQPDRDSHGWRPVPFVTDQTTRLVLPSHIEAVADAAAALGNFVRGCGVSEESAFGIEMAVREAVTNAMVHGNQEDEAKSVEVILNCHENELEVEIRDQGRGFDPAEVPDPTNPENLLKTSGRGIFLMRTFMDEIEWLNRPEGGTVVRMTKRF